jgi:putative ABC transport system permease protein
MKAGVTLVLAVKSLVRHRVRTALAMLGIIIGIAAVIAMVAIGQGTAEIVQAQIASMGRNILMIWPGAAASGGFSWGAGTNVTLTSEDAEALRKEVPELRAVTVTVRTRTQVVYEGRNWNPQTINGTDASFPYVRDWALLEGEYFEERDVISSAKVCVIGLTIEENLFLGESSLGRTVRIKNIPFRVIGVLSRKGTSSYGNDQDDIVLVPWTTCKNVLQGSAFRNVDQIMISVREADEMDAALASITDVLRARHRLQEKDPSDFQIRTMNEMASTAKETQETMSRLLAAIASISLLVGGIGIMNIMLVSVTERTREIGLRLAVGARGRDILQQFLMEAVLLSGSAGLIGMALGAGAAIVWADSMQTIASLSMQTMVTAAVFSCAVGIFFGFYPAMRAARLDPIEALRWE